jgi:hypothetical protein
MRKIEPFDLLISTHPRSQARDELLDPTLLDFDMLQTGHGSPAGQHAAKALTGWDRPPRMPVISGESRYEALEIKPMLHAKEAREAFWAHLLNSGCAGHTYGANGIWQVNLPDKRFGKSPGGNDWGGTPWREAMRLPGFTQIAHAKRFLLTLPWHQFMPATNVLQGQTSAAITPDRRCAVAYTHVNQPISADLAAFARPVCARWFDLTNGEFKPIEGSPFSANGKREFTSPATNAAGDGDWVLLLQKGASQ